MRTTGTTARGIRTPIISSNDNLVEIVTNSLLRASESEGFKIEEGDIVGVTEAVVAKAQGNFATIEELGRDVAKKFPEGEVGVVFPIFSRNRFLNILKGIALGAKKVYVLLSYPQDEVGNPIVDWRNLDDVNTDQTLFSGKEFREIYGEYGHEFTGVDYIKLYEEVGDNVEVYLSQDPRDILKLTPYVIEAEIHLRDRTKLRLERAGAKRVFKLDELLAENPTGGYNDRYGVLGSNISTGQMLKLFPRDCDKFVLDLQKSIFEKTNKNIEVLVYGDGAFKDPQLGIWELADPVVSPGFTQRLGGQPNEIKLKYIADNTFGDLSGEAKSKAVSDFIKEKGEKAKFSEGTTPRKYADLVGSLCDLMSGSGDKGTPVVYIKGYFDDYSKE